MANEEKSVPVGGAKYFVAKQAHPYHSREDMIEKILELEARIVALEKPKKD